MRVSVYRKAHFNSAHRLYRKDWSMEKNDEVFGLCNNPSFHGHNYQLEVRVTGEINAETGYLIDLKILKDLIENEIIERFDHRNLNLDTAEFQDLNPTVENMAVVIYDLLRKKLDPQYDLGIRLYETDRNYVDYPAVENRG